MIQPERDPDVVVVGGAGHVGAPLAIVLAHKGYRVVVNDLNDQAMEILRSGKMPFLEVGGEQLLKEVLPTGRLTFTTDRACVARANYVVITIGTPVDGYQNPLVHLVTECIDGLLPHLSDSSLIVLRSTIFPGVTDRIQRHIAAKGRRIGVAFCPERVVQGDAIREVQGLPQIVSGSTPEAEEAAARLFAPIAPKILRMTPKEAEYAKLISNAYRYIQFAATNQFYMMLTAEGLDYNRVLQASKDGYPRLADLPRPGFSAGPCLHKDTVQLAASFTNKTFGLGLAAIHVNEGLPQFIVSEIGKRAPIGELTVGILGMAFKAESDDTRSSLSYKLKKILAYEAKAILTTDPFVTTDPTLLPLAEVVERSDFLVVATPHGAYRGLDLSHKQVLDVWNVVRAP